LLPAATVGVLVGVDVGVWTGVGVAVAVTVGVAVGVGVGVPLPVGDGVAVGVGVGVAVAVDVGDGVGVAVAPEDAVGAAVGVAVEDAVGVAVGVLVGVEVGVEVGVAVGAGVDVGVEVEAPAVWTTNWTLLDAASSELNSYPSLLALSIASERNEPALAATVEVRSASVQTEIAPPGVKVCTVAPFVGAFPKSRVPSDQVLSDTALILCRPPEPLVTHIRNLADRTVWPASDCRPNFRYVWRIGEESDSKMTAVPKLLAGRSPAT